MAQRKEAKRRAKQPSEGVRELKPMGRPSKLLPGFIAAAKEMCDRGMTDEEIAIAFNVSRRTIYQWAADNKDFSHALKLGKEAPDERVIRSLFHRAIGYSYPAVKIFCDAKTGAVKLVDYVEHCPPDTTACIFWLKNRRREDWRDRVDHTQIPADDQFRVNAAVESFRAACKNEKTGEMPSVEEAVKWLAPHMDEVKQLGKIG